MRRWLFEITWLTLLFAAIVAMPFWGIYICWP